ncbi:MAG: ATP-binding protein, partial [Chloroflexota bacterium]
GLNAVDQAIIAQSLTEGIYEFLQDLEYRVAHRAWDEIMSLQVAVERVKAESTGKTVIPTDDLTAEQVLELLNEGELLQLGLSEGQLALSTIGTRCTVLENWIELKQGDSTFYTADMSHDVRVKLDALYSAFRTMVAMRHLNTPTGEHIGDDSISPYRLYELIYPKTDALDEGCVFVSLLGRKPGSAHRQALTELIEGKEWIPDRFIFVFIPGCTPRLKSALENEYSKKGVVVIDEPTLLDLILAEAVDSKPIGQLRALMLNSRPLQYIDIFKINQLVDTRTSIFVGRANVINQIVSSGDNYAIYGGRRIGKSSVLNAVRERLEKRNYYVVYESFEGFEDCSDHAVAAALARRMPLPGTVNHIDELRYGIQQHLDSNPSVRIVMLLDEVDKYIDHNPKRHLLVETLRTLSERYRERFRVIVAGFMHLYDCMRGGGPYTTTSDPWGRMFNEKLLGNLSAENAESIVREGFLEVLGWKFQYRLIPQRVVERTGGHPAFVQKFSEKLQDYVAERKAETIMMDDLDYVFHDADPEDSFIDYVQNTLAMNLDAVARYSIISLVGINENIQQFSYKQIKDYARLTD